MRGGLRIWALAAAILVFSPLAVCAQGLLDMAHFRARMIEALKASEPGVRIKVVSEDELEIGSGPGSADDRLAYLGNAYENYRADPAQLDQVLQRYVRVFLQAAHENPIKPTKLVVLVRPRSFITYAAERFAKAGNSGADNVPLNRPFAGDLVAVVASDEGEAFSYPPLDSVRKAFKDDRAAWSAATQNTRARMGEVVVEPLRQGAFIVHANPDVTASLLVDETVWTRPTIKFAVKTPVVLVTKTALLMVDADDAQAVAGLRKLVGEMAKDPDLVTDELLVRRNNVWTVLEH
jgi:hypothetical protein